MTESQLICYVFGMEGNNRVTVDLKQNKSRIVSRLCTLIVYRSPAGISCIATPLDNCATYSKTSQIGYIIPVKSAITVVVFNTGLYCGEWRKGQRGKSQYDKSDVFQLYLFPDTARIRLHQEQGYGFG